MAKQRSKELRTSQASYLLAESRDSLTSAREKAASLYKFCSLVAGGEHEIPDSDVQTARVTLKRLATAGAREHLDAARSGHLTAKTSNFAKSTRDTLYLAERNYRSFLEYVAWGADVKPQDVEDAHITLASVLFALQRYPEALEKATTFTTEFPEHKRPMPWMILAYGLLEINKAVDEAREAYLVARARWDALQPYEREDEKIGRQLTMNTLARKFPPPQAASGKSPRPAKKQRTDQPASAASTRATLPAETCQTGSEEEATPLEEFVGIRVASMEARIKAKQDHFRLRGPTEKQLLFYGEEWAEDCIGSWSGDHVNETTLLDMWIRQDSRCALSGQPMSTRINDPNVGSVDRKDSRRGYTADNVQWVCAWVNYMKSSMPEGLFFQRCMTLGSRYTEWSVKKMADMEEQLLERKRETDVGEQPDEAEEQEGKGKEKMDH